jgi:hypothetical protein
MNKELLKYSGIAVAGIGTGYLAGYLITNKRLEKKLRDEFHQELRELKEHYNGEVEKLRMVRKDGEFATVGEAVEALAEKREVLTEEEAELYNEENVELLKTQGYSENAEVQPTVESIWDKGENIEEPEVEVESNWPGNPDDDEDEPGEFNTLDGPEIVRSPDYPYVISIEEYMVDDDDYEKLTFGYYDQDGVLADDAEKPVPDIEGTVGIKNLEFFGLLSQNKDIVYVRNEKKHIDFEICRDEGSYTELVLGYKVPAEPRARAKKSREDD